MIKKYKAIGKRTFCAEQRHVIFGVEAQVNMLFLLNLPNDTTADEIRMLLDEIELNLRDEGWDNISLWEEDWNGRCN